MTDRLVRYETAGRAAVVTLARPEARNAVNRELAGQLADALDRLEQDPSVRVGVLAAEGPVFCAGADLKAVVQAGTHPVDARDGIPTLVRRVRTKPLIAAVQGPAVAGGAEIVLSCDLVVASHEASFGIPEVKRSFIAGAGGLYRFARTLPRMIAMELALTGDPMPASDAYRLGLVNRLVDRDALLPTALELAERIAANAPLAVVASRRVVAAAAGLDDQAMWDLSRAELDALRETEDFAEGPRAFVEKRDPVWKGALTVRIGLNGPGLRTIEQAKEAEAAGFATLWYPSVIDGDPLVTMALAGRATTSIELGTAVLQTYPVHPAVQARRIAATAAAMGRPGLTLGIGPSHREVVESMYGMSYARPGRHTEEYIGILTASLRGERVDVEGDELTADIDGLAADVPVLLAALGKRLLRVAGQHCAGTITWMANTRGLEGHVTPRLRSAAAAAGRPPARVVAGLPVAVHDDVAAAREQAQRSFAFYGELPNYQRILAVGGLARPADACIVGDEQSVAAQIRALFDAGATDLWAVPFPVGDDRDASRRRTRALLTELAGDGAPGGRADPDARRRGEVRIGCSGWAYADWRGIVYPKDLPQRRWLEHYATRFDTVEINNTFYRLPAPDTVDLWAREAPPPFLFAVKLGAFGSHRMKLRDAVSWLPNHLDRVERLGRGLGPTLVQLPPRWRRNAARLDEFLTAAPVRLRWAVEVRDASWLHDDVLDVLRRHDAALCIHDLLPDHPWTCTTSWTYVRFHGPHATTGPYVGRYGGRRLWRAADRLGQWVDDGVDVYAYFNNDVHGDAVLDAQWLRDRLRGTCTPRHVTSRRRGSRPR